MNTKQNVLLLHNITLNFSSETTPPDTVTSLLP